MSSTTAYGFLLARMKREKKMSYRDEVLRTGKSSLDSLSDDQSLSLGALGIAGEAGEVADLIKKTVFHKKPMDRENLVKELGDVRWYFEYLMIATGITMEEVERVNIEKLRIRFPNGFTPEDAAKRVDVKK